MCKWYRHNGHLIQHSKGWYYRYHHVTLLRYSDTAGEEETVGFLLAHVFSTAVWQTLTHCCPTCIHMTVSSVTTGSNNACRGFKFKSRWRHQMGPFSALLALCVGNSPVPVNFPHKGQWRGALMFSLICTRMNDWVNNREAGDLRRYRAHYDIIVMLICLGKTHDECTDHIWCPCDKSYFLRIVRKLLNHARNQGTAVIQRCYDQKLIKRVETHNKYSTTFEVGPTNALPGDCRNIESGAKNGGNSEQHDRRLIMPGNYHFKFEVNPISGLSRSVRKLLDQWETRGRLNTEMSCYQYMHSH